MVSSCYKNGHLTVFLPGRSFVVSQCCCFQIMRCWIRAYILYCYLASVLAHTVGSQSSFCFTAEGFWKGLRFIELGRSLSWASHHVRHLRARFSRKNPKKLSISSNSVGCFWFTQMIAIHGERELICKLQYRRYPRIILSDTYNI